MLSQSCSGRSSSLKVPSRDSASPFTHISSRQASPFTTISRGRASAFTTPSRGRSTPLNATFRGRSSTLSTLLLLAFLPIIGKFSSGLYRQVSIGWKWTESAAIFQTQHFTNSIPYTQHTIQIYTYMTTYYLNISYC